MDVRGGGNLPKLQFTIFVPSAEFFRTLRTSQASLDLQEKYGVTVEDNGLERFLTATRRQLPRSPVPPPRLPPDRTSLTRSGQHQATDPCALDWSRAD